MGVMSQHQKTLTDAKNNTDEFLNLRGRVAKTMPVMINADSLTVNTRVGVEQLLTISGRSRLGLWSHRGHWNRLDVEGLLARGQRVRVKGSLQAGQRNLEACEPKPTLRRHVEKAN